jgi:tetratricopeptide (TPR) repeat protein
MALDPYSPCPCGSGKKLKFCCSDMSNELEQVQRMIEGEQFLACLDYLNKLETKFPGRAFVLSTKAMLQAQLGMREEAEQTVQELLRLHPNNPVALAESAIFAAQGEEAPQVVQSVQKAIEGSPTPLPQAVYQAIEVAARRLLMEGYLPAARAHFYLLAALDPSDQEPLRVLQEIQQSPNWPLLLKEDWRFEPAPENVIWKKDSDSALADIGQARWGKAERTWSKLAERQPREASLWRNLAILRMWLADEPGACQAWRKYAALNAQVDEAVEAEALAQMFDPQIQPDQVNLLEQVTANKDIDRLMERLASDRRAVSLPIDPRTVARDENEPPPKYVYALLDRAQPSEGETLTAETLPHVVGQVLLYGRQTDREARVALVGYAGPLWDQGKLLLAEIGGDTLGTAQPDETLEAVDGWQMLLRPNWYVPPTTSPAQLADWTREYRRGVVFDQWPDRPNGIWKGKTPREMVAAGDVRSVAAAILGLEQSLSSAYPDFDFDELRRSLGVPTAQPIDPWNQPIEPSFPISRMGRLQIEKLTDEELITCYARAMQSRAQKALRNLAQELASRGSFDKKPEKAAAYGTLASLSREPQQALAYFDKAREAAEAAGQSTAPWDMEELMMHIQQGDTANATRLMNHLSTEHANEPGVRESLRQLLMAIGAIGPDGRSLRPREGAMPAAMAAEPAAAAPGKLWTPDGGGGTAPAAPGGQKPTIWTPGME